jgi:uncharacterized damage-inducible protein DinB
MALNEAFIQELKKESALTKKVLERIPDDKFSWKPHEKSTSFGALAHHVAELPSWIAWTIETESIDLNNLGEQPKRSETQADLLQFADSAVEKAITALENTSDEVLQKNWKMFFGDHLLLDLPKHEVIRMSLINHMIHHRGQLTVYLRMNDIAVPGLYGPSADEQ